MSPSLLLLDEPTRGIDIGAKQEVYLLMEKLAKEGMAILFVSSELEEILGMSDRTLVMHEGAISGELGRDELSEEAVMQLANRKPASRLKRQRRIYEKNPGYYGPAGSRFDANRYSGAQIHDPVQHSEYDSLDLPLWYYQYWGCLCHYYWRHRLIGGIPHSP